MANNSTEYQKWYRKKNYRTLNLTLRNKEMAWLKALSDLYAEKNGAEPNLIRYVTELAKKDSVNYDAKEIKKRTEAYELAYEKEVENIPDWVPKKGVVRRKNRNRIWPHCEINPEEVKKRLKVGCRVIVHKFAETPYIRNWQNGRRGTVIALHKTTAAIQWDKTDENIPYFTPENLIPYNNIEIIHETGLLIGERVSIHATEESAYKESDGVTGVIESIDDDIVTVASINGKSYKTEYFCIKKDDIIGILKNFKKK
jgi:hypothetical protein